MTELEQEVERLRADLRAALDGWRWALARADAMEASARPRPADAAAAQARPARQPSTTP